MKAPRHLYDSTNGLPLCGGPARERAVHPSKARRDDCPRCRKLYRSQVKAARIRSLLAAARQTEFDDVARRLQAEAARLKGAELPESAPWDVLPDATGPVTILAVRPPDTGPRRSFLVGEIRLAVEKFGGAALAELILAHLQAPPSLPKERIR